MFVSGSCLAGIAVTRVVIIFFLKVDFFIILLFSSYWVLGCFPWDSSAKRHTCHYCYLIQTFVLMFLNLLLIRLNNNTEHSFISILFFFIWLLHRSLDGTIWFLFLTGTLLSNKNFNFFNSFLAIYNFFSKFSIENPRQVAHGW